MNVRFCLLSVAFLASSSLLGQTPKAPAEAAATKATAEAPAPRSSVKLLTIGNSFADNATAFLPGLAAAGGKKLILFKANLGGHSFAQHAGYVKAFEADPASAKGHAYKARTNPLTGEKKDFSLREALEMTDWDYVTIQQVSNNSYKYETFQPDAGFLIANVRKYAPKAEILIHETWSYPPDFLAKGKYNVDQQTMYDQLHAAYQKLSEESGGLRVIPVGTAFQAARSLPTPMNLNAAGDKHANAAGQYLGGAVFYEALFRDSVEAVDFVPPKGVNAEQAKTLRQIAHQTVAKSTPAAAKKP